MVAKMKEKSFLNEILSPKLLVIAWGFIITLCVFIGFSMRGKCATSPDYSLPLPIGIPKKLKTGRHKCIKEFVIPLALRTATHIIIAAM